MPRCVRESSPRVQANEIASAAAADPGAAAELVAVARDNGVAGLRDKCRRVRAAAAPDEMARHRAIHASRSLRHWSDPDGAGRLDGRFTPEVLAELLVALEPFEAEAFRVARDEGRREGFDAYRADARWRWSGPGVTARPVGRRDRTTPCTW